MKVYNSWKPAHHGETLIGNDFDSSYYSADFESYYISILYMAGFEVFRLSPIVVNEFSIWSN